MAIKLSDADQNERARHYANYAPDAPEDQHLRWVKIMLARLDADLPVATREQITGELIRTCNARYNPS